MPLSDDAKRAVPQNQGYKLSFIIALWRIPCKLTGCFTPCFAAFVIEYRCFWVKAGKNILLILRV